jgi:universal stress protein A
MTVIKKPKSYKHILFATDLISNDEKIQSRVKELAGHYGAKISILHVVESIPPFVDVYGYFGSQDLMAKMQEDARIALEKMGRSFHLSGENLKLEVGSPKAEIVRVAVEITADLIVVGTHSRHGLDRLLGSTANAVVQTAQCDVLTVRYEHNIE